MQHKPPKGKYFIEQMYSIKNEPDYVDKAYCLESNDNKHAAKIYYIKENNSKETKVAEVEGNPADYAIDWAHKKIKQLNK